MEKRYIEKLDMSISPLGFGVMRLPMHNGKIAEDACKLISYAMENGINYFDTAYIYQHELSEEFIRDTIVAKYLRNSFYIADKLPAWMCKSRDDMEHIFQTQLTRLGIECIDFYLLHSLNTESWNNIYKLDVLDFLREKKEEGKINKIGFSLHDSVDALVAIENAFNWDFVQLQINYYDWNIQHVDKSYAYLVEKEIPCFVMGPVGGGRLDNLPKDAKRIFADNNPSASCSSWAMRYVASLPNVAVILSGMSTMEQLKDNISTFSPFTPLSADENKIISEVVEILESSGTVPCTSCEYCLDDCPKSINIPDLFQKYNDSILFDNVIQFKMDYFGPFLEGKRGADCLYCGKCVELCPQKINIPDELKTVHDAAVSHALGIKTEELRNLLDKSPESLLVFFCAGQFSKNIQMYLHSQGIRVSHFCDNSDQLWGKELNGIIVINPDKLLSLTQENKVYLFIASNVSHAVEQIRKQLAQMGMFNENCVCLNQEEV